MKYKLPHLVDHLSWDAKVKWAQLVVNNSNKIEMVNFTVLSPIAACLFSNPTKK